jgi:hypothetical protein
MGEQRRDRRYYVAQGARIAGADGGILTTCRILDISARGARLEMDALDTVPDDFILLLSRDGRLRRQCLTVWRSETAIGVEFVPDASGTRS